MEQWVAPDGRRYQLGVDTVRSGGMAHQIVRLSYEVAAELLREAGYDEEQPVEPEEAVYTQP